MTIDPFIAGILATIIAELVIINVAAIVSMFTKPKKSKKENNDGTNNDL